MPDQPASKTATPASGTVPLGPLDDEVRRTLGRPELARLLAQARDRLEYQGVPASGLWSVSGRVRLPDATPEERAGLQALLGPVQIGDEEVVVPLSRLDAALRTSKLRMGLVEALERLGGPLRDRQAERSEAEATWQAAFAAAARSAAVAAHPELARWLEAVRRDGLVRRVARGDPAVGTRLLEQAVATLGRLPADQVRLGELADQATGDAHALDRGSALASLVAHGLAALLGADVPASADGWRRLWAMAGVVCDELSCDVLAAGLRPSGGTLAGPLRELAGAGEPVRLTLRQLTRGGGLRFEGDTAAVFACQNPVVVAEAVDRFGDQCPPLVCLDGSPNAAATTLLQALTAGGASLCYHGDFDWAGVRTGNLLAARFSLEPWAFTATAYEQACERLANASPLVGAAVPAVWDPELLSAMLTRGVAVYEEQVLDLLLGPAEPGPRP